MRDGLSSDYEDFRNFLWLVWRNIGLPDPTPTQYDIAGYMQDAPNRAMVQAFRGVGKSFLLAARCAHALALNPDEKVMVISAGGKLAADFTNFVWTMVNNIDELKFLRPRPDQRRSSIAFDVGPAKPSKDTSVFACGVFGQMTGHRGSLIVADDIETPRTSETVTQREKLVERSRELDAIVTPGGRIMYLGTPQCQDTTYSTLPERGYEVKVWPVQTPTEAQMEAYGDHLADSVRALAEEQGPGVPVDPVRFPENEIEERRRAYGPSGFALQFMLDPTLADTDLYPLKQRDIMVYHIDPLGVPGKIIHSPENERHMAELPNVGIRGDRIFKGLVLPEDDAHRFPLPPLTCAVDPAGTGKDETGWAIGSAMHGYFWVVGSGGLRGVGDRDMDELCDHLRRWDVKTLVLEPNYGKGVFKKLFEDAIKRNQLECSVLESKWAQGRKEKRIIQTLYPVLANHRLVMDASVFTSDQDSVQHHEPQHRLAYRLFYQLTHLSEQPGCLVHDDRLDALALLIDWLQENGGVQNTDEALRQSLEQAWEDHLAWLDNMGNPTRGGTPNRRPTRR